MVQPVANNRKKDVLNAISQAGCHCGCLLFAIALTVTISPLAGFALALPVTVVSGFALFRPLPRLGLGSRVFAGVIFIFVGLGNLAFFQDVAERETYLAAPAGKRPGGLSGRA